MSWRDRLRVRPGSEHGIRVVCLDCGHRSTWLDLDHDEPCSRCDGVSWAPLAGISVEELRACIASRGSVLSIHSDREFLAEVRAELALDIARLKGALLRCVDCGGPIEPALAELGSVRCHDCRP